MSAAFSRDAAAPIALAVLCIVGIGLVASTVDTAEPVGAADGDPVFEPPDTGPEAPQEPGDSDGQPRLEGEADPSQESALRLSTCVSFLNSTLGTGLVVAGFLGLVGLVYYRFNFSAALLAGWTGLPPVALVYFLATNCGGGGIGSGGTAGGSSALDPGSSPVAPLTNVPPWAVGLVIGGVLLGAVGLLYRSMGGSDVVTLEDEDDDDEPALDQFAEAAGRAADRIEERNADVDNAVYRAWVEMTELLDVDEPELYTPGEFADEAVALGMAESDVGELTELFNEVRYGGRDAESREDQAISILRDIEESYGATTDADGSAVGSAGGDDGPDGASSGGADETREDEDDAT